MARTPTERLLQQQIQTRFPRLSRHWRRALARWVLGARLAGSAKRPALAHARATAGIARAATLADAWDAWIAAPAHRIDTADPPAAGAAGGPSAGVRRRPAPRDSRALDRRTAGARTGCRPSARCHRSGAHERPLAGRRPAGRHPPEPPARGGGLGGAAHQPGAGEPPWERMLRWARSALPLDQQVRVLADQGVGRPRRWPAIRSQQFHPIMRGRTTSPVAPTGQAPLPVLRLAPGPGHGWVGVGVAFKHAPKRIAGTRAVARGAGHAEPWAPRGERPAAQVDAAGSALRRWDAAGFRQRKSMGWDWQRGQVTDPDAVAWQ